MNRPIREPLRDNIDVAHTIMWIDVWPDVKDESVWSVRLQNNLDVVPDVAWNLVRDLLV